MKKAPRWVLVGFFPLLFSSSSYGFVRLSLPKPMPEAKVGQKYSVDLKVYTTTDDPDHLHYYSLDNLPFFLTLDEKTGLLEGTPTIEDVPGRGIVIEVDDSVYAAVSYSKLVVAK